MKRSLPQLREFGFDDDVQHFTQREQIGQAARFWPFRDYVEYRIRATEGSGGLFVAQCVVLWFLGRLGVARTLRVTLPGLARAATR